MHYGEGAKKKHNCYVWLYELRADSIVIHEKKGSCVQKKEVGKNVVFNPFSIV